MVRPDSLINMLLKDLRGLVLTFLPPNRSLAARMCVVAFSRVHDCLTCSGYDSCPDLKTEVRTHSNILHNCRRYGVSFGSRPTLQTLRQHMRLVEELYMTLEVEDEGVHNMFAPALPVFAFSRVRQFHWGYQWRIFDDMLLQTLVRGC